MLLTEGPRQRGLADTCNAFKISAGLWYRISAHVLLSQESYMAKPKAKDVDYILNHFKQECRLPQKKLLISSCTNPLLVRVSPICSLFSSCRFLFFFKKENS